jgi:exopolyphosphatase/guanosine-5'-triphosphate,3'-diphosphate pyrophosphatase
VSLGVGCLTHEEADALERVLATSRWQVAHVRQVQTIAPWLFAALRPYHGLGEPEEKLLLGAALLHDVGYPTDPSNHHKASARIIRSHLGPPFDEAQVEMIALLARYHRKTLPKLEHRRYAGLDAPQRRTVGWLGGILRVADGLDRSHREAVHAISVVRVDGRLEIIAEGAEPEDVTGAMRKRDLLERALGMALVVRAA